MLASLVSSCTIQIHLLNQLLFVSPPPSLPSVSAPPAATASDAVLRGIVELRVPSPRRIGGVKVRLKGMLTIAVPADPNPSGGGALFWEEETVMDKTVEIGVGSGRLDGRGQSQGGGKEKERSKSRDPGGMELEKGVHAFEFAFTIPSWCPPYERSKHGRTRYVVTATALAAGHAWTSITAWREVFIIANPSASGPNGLNPLEITHSSSHDGLGIVYLALLSPSLHVSGKIVFHARLEAPERGIKVWEARLSIEQMYELKSSEKGWRTMPTEKKHFWSMGKIPVRDKDGYVLSGPEQTVTPLYVEGEAYEDSEEVWEIRERPRLPDDKVIRPSTGEGTRTSIRVKHEVIIELFYSTDKEGSSSAENPDPDRGRLKVFAYRRKINIPSCCCSIFDLTLPPYSPSANSTPIGTPSPDDAKKNSGWPGTAGGTVAGQGSGTRSTSVSRVGSTSSLTALTARGRTSLPATPPASSRSGSPMPQPVLNTDLSTSALAPSPWLRHLGLSLDPFTQPLDTIRFPNLTAPDVHHDWQNGSTTCVCGMELSALDEADRQVLAGLGMDESPLGPSISGLGGRGASGSRTRGRSTVRDTDGGGRSPAGSRSGSAAPSREASEERRADRERRRAEWQEVRGRAMHRGKIGELREDELNR